MKRISARYGGTPKTGFARLGGLRGAAVAVVALVAASSIFVAVPAGAAPSTTSHPLAMSSRDKVTAGHPGTLHATVHFIGSAPKAGRLAASTAPPNAPFYECPGVNYDSSCGILVYVTDHGATVVSNPAQGPYDGGDDTLVGVLNASSRPINSLSLVSTTGAFDFDGDGICAYSGWAGSAQCYYGPTGYEGPGTQLSGSGNSGSVAFTNTLTPGGSAYFGLENALSAATLSQPSSYAALGDSYSSGEGTADKNGPNGWYSNPSTSQACQRGPGAWPILMAAASGTLNITGSGANRSFFACGGATTSKNLSGSSWKGEISQVAQLQQWVSTNGSPGLVSMTAGGNNVHFADVLGACYAGGIASWAGFIPGLQGVGAIGSKACPTAIGAVEIYLTLFRQNFVNQLAKLYSAAANAAGTSSRVVVVGYPRIMPTPSLGNIASADYHCPWIALNPAALPEFSQVTNDLNGDIRQAAALAGVTYVNVEGALSGHELCTGSSHINSLSLINKWNGEAGHPTKDGQVSLANTILSDIRNAGLPVLRRKGQSVGHAPKMHAFAAPLAIHASGTTLAVDTSDIPSATVGVPYLGFLGAVGGTDPYSWSVTSGSLPSGLSLDGSTGIISGQTSATGSSTFTVTVTDSTSPTMATASKSVTLASVAAPTLSTIVPTSSNGTVGQQYNLALAGTGGTDPVTWSTASTLPAGLTLDPQGTISGTPTSTGNTTVAFTATDSSSPTAESAGVTTTIHIVPASTPLSTSISAPSGIQGSYYFGQLSSAGGTAPVTWALSSGTLPDGLSVDSSSGQITGVATSSGTFPVTFTATDRTSPTAQTSSVSTTINVAVGTSLSIMNGSLSNAIQGIDYESNLNATGGVAPYSWYVSSGTLPPGLSLDGSTGSISGLPSESGNFTFGVTLNDSATPSAGAASHTYAISVQASSPAITFAPPAATIGTPYFYSPGVAGGVPSYSWSLSSGTLPAGLSLDPSTGQIAGTPTTLGSSTVTIQVSDSSVPVGQSVLSTATITVSAAPHLAIMTLAIGNAINGLTYRTVLAATGGTSPDTWAISSGSLPTGLTLDTATGVISGVPTVNGTSSFTAQVTDSSSPTATTASLALALTVGNPAPLSVATSSLPNATAGSNYSQGLLAVGGIAPYSWSLASGSLPGGLTISASGSLSGTPTSSGTFSFAVQCSDNSLPTPQTASASLTLTVDSASPMSFGDTTLATATEGNYYYQQISVTGGVNPYSFSLSSGSLPVGMALDSYGNLDGYPASFGTFNFTVQATDSSTPAVQTVAAPFSLYVVPAGPMVVAQSSGALPAGTQGQYYCQSIGLSGGVGPYMVTVTSGALPDGVTADAYGDFCGEITSSTSASVTVSISDSQAPTPSVLTETYSIPVAPAPPLSVAPTVPNFILGQYAYQFISISGGVPGYGVTVVKSKLPTGLYISGTEIYGAATKTGSGSIQVRVTDLATPSAGTVLTTVTFKVVKAPKLKVTSKKLVGGTVGSYYQQSLTATGGVPGYSWAVTTGTLPPGLSLSGPYVYGYPTVKGLYSFTVTATDSASPANTAVGKVNLKVS